jgi:hypothetical protein
MLSSPTYIISLPSSSLLFAADVLLLFCIMVSAIFCNVFLRFWLLSVQLMLMSDAKLYDYDAAV